MQSFIKIAIIFVMIKVMKILLLLTVVYSLACYSPDPAEQRRLLIIGIDGCRPDALQKAQTPNIDALWKNGSYSFAAQTDLESLSGPCWTSMLTGVWHDKHGVVSNNYRNPNVEKYPHFFRRIKEIKPELFTVSLVNWSPIHKILRSQDADVCENHKPDEKLAKVAAEVLSNQNPTAVFVAFDDLDHAGHEYGFDPENRDYLNAIEKVDELAGVVLKALKARKTYHEEKWLVLVSTDHGGKGKNHGGQSPEELTTFFIAHGPTVKSGKIEQASFIVDVAATALEHLRIAIDPEWNLDGKPIGLKKANR